MTAMDKMAMEIVKQNADAFNKASGIDLYSLSEEDIDKMVYEAMNANIAILKEIRSKFE